MFKYFFFWLITVMPALAFGQRKAIDSLQNRLTTTRTGVDRVDLLNELASALYNYDVMQAYDKASEAYNLAKSVDYADGMRFALIMKAFYFFGNGNYAEALKYHRQSAALETASDDLKAYNLVMIGNVFQALAQYDSALNAYQQAIEIEESIGSSKYLAYAYKNLGRLHVLQWKNAEAEAYFQKAIGYYRKNNSTRSLADTWYSMADVKSNLGAYDEANALVLKACAVGEELDDEFLKLYCLINKGEISFSTGEYADALDQLFLAMEKIKDVELPHVLARLYQDLGDVHEALGQNEVALNYFLESLKVAERLGIKHEIAKVKSGIAWIYKNQKNFRLAHQFINESLELRQQIRDDHGISNCYNVRGLIFLEEKKYDPAIHSLDQSLEIRRRLQYKNGIAACLFNKALVLEELGNYREALDLQLQAIRLESEIGNKFDIGISYNGIGSVYTKLKDFRNAAHYLRLGEQMAQLTGSRMLRMNNNRYWAELYEMKNDFKTALDYHKKYAALNDSIYSEMSAGKIAELLALYQVEQKDHQIQSLNQERALQDAQIRLQRSRINLQTIIIVSVVIGLVLASLLAFKTYQYNQRISKANREIIEQKEEIQSQSEELIEANSTIANINKELENKIEQRTEALTQAYKELDTFFYRASHDFRRPLTTFLGLAEVANVTVKDPGALELFAKVRETAHNLDKMVLKLQSISDVGSQELVFKEVLIKEIFDNVCDSYRDELQRKNIKAACELKLTAPFVSYPAMVKTIIENLVENSIQFCGVDKCFIKLKANGNGSYVTLELHDNGQGISQEYHDLIFEMYFRGSDRSKGNGLGLYIVRKAVEKLEGTIALSSTVGSGTVFTIVLPNHHA